MAHWDGLADGATTILIPLAPAPFAPLYGMLTDRYGITWIVGVETPAVDLGGPQVSCGAG